MNDLSHQPSAISLLKNDVFQANLALVKHGLVTLTWGNASGIDRERGLVVIKPSGVPYDTMTADDMVVVDFATGAVVDSRLKPSSDLATHLALYRAWPEIGGVVHAHSVCATTFAQTCCNVPCIGTTHADHFNGDVPCTRDLTRDEVMGDYEANTGAVIVECFDHAGLDPLAMPAALVARHGPFTWGTSAARAVEQAVALEVVCHMAQLALAHPKAPGAFPAHILQKHFERKHGPNAYYGQGKKA